MNTYIWSIGQLDCKPQEDGLTDIVVVGHWRVDATDGTHTAGVYGTQSFTLEQGSNFTPFEDLTEEQVVSWVQESMGIDAVTALQENLDNQIEALVHPAIVSPTLPWAQTV